MVTEVVLGWSFKILNSNDLLGIWTTVVNIWI